MSPWLVPSAPSLARPGPPAPVPSAPQGPGGSRLLCAGRSVPGDRCALHRTLLQQLQKLQTLVTSNMSRPYKMAATQTGTCLMVGAAGQPAPARWGPR